MENSPYLDMPKRELEEIEAKTRRARDAAEMECRQLNAEYAIAVAVYDNLCERHRVILEAIAHRETV